MRSTFNLDDALYLPAAFVLSSTPVSRKSRIAPRMSSLRGFIALIWHILRFLLILLPSTPRSGLDGTLYNRGRVEERKRHASLGLNSPMGTSMLCAGFAYQKLVADPAGPRTEILRNGCTSPGLIGPEQKDIRNSRPHLLDREGKMFQEFFNKARDFRKRYLHHLVFILNLFRNYILLCFERLLPATLEHTYHHGSITSSDNRQWLHQGK